ncbi:hypothetical protein ARALYDRAFT_900658 [Arabidopsis lyrata subsp. lyrata]|uniref:Uncharacterized protein n=1 Tax=Arabidopsis lyrata subsp. lyrata TaxID=81972 RepID=D7LDC2_ARALL|nr:hypothetical protein ARALYDRAFT_900658 [Arabidopsis lyrata subsp. lyrata]
MSSTRRGSKRTRPDPPQSLQDDSDVNVFSDLKEIMSALQQIREKAHEDARKQKEESISSVSTEVKSKIDELKSKLEKERQNFAKALSNECESILKDKAADKADHLQSLKGKKEETMITEHEKFCTEKLAQLEESLKKKKLDDENFTILRKTLGSFLENEASDEEYPPDE